MSVSSLCEKHNKERDQPLKTLRALIEFDFHAKVVLHDHFQILTIGNNAQPIGLPTLQVRHPGAAKFLGQPNAGGVELIRSAVELVAIFLKSFDVARFWLSSFS